MALIKEIGYTPAQYHDAAEMIRKDQTTPDSNKHQPVNTAREKQDRQRYYRNTDQGIRGRGTR